MSKQAVFTSNIYNLQKVTLQEQHERCVDQKSGQTQHTATTTTVIVAKDVAHARNVPVLCLAFVGLQLPRLRLHLCVACHEPG